eukprot:6179106-Pleurochrysis_carterae.AAC.5
MRGPLLCMRQAAAMKSMPMATALGGDCANECKQLRRATVCIRRRPMQPYAELDDRLLYAKQWSSRGAWAVGVPEPKSSSRI